MPPSVRHFDYLPLSQLLPRCAAIVHHGGIGTTAQGFAAGIPQLMMPMAFDQPDNAARAERLGVARSISPRAFRPAAVARLLDQLIDRPETAASCQRIAQQCHDPHRLDPACDAICDSHCGGCSRSDEHDEWRIPSLVARFRQPSGLRQHQCSLAPSSRRDVNRGLLSGTAASRRAAGPAGSGLS